MAGEPASDSARLVETARAVRGVVAAAVVSSQGEVLAAAGDEAALLERMQQAATSALAAAEAFSGLFDEAERTAPDEGGEGADEADADGTQHLTVLYQDGPPLLFSPVPGERLMVVAVATPADIGRARFQLKRLGAG